MTEPRDPGRTDSELSDRSTQAISGPPPLVSAGELAASDPAATAGRGDPSVLASTLGGSSGPAPLVPAQVGRFEVRAYLGGGAFGWVYRAFDPVLRRDVAIKLPRPDRLQSATDRERFLREARAAATVRHPHVVPVHEVGESNGTPFIVMGFVPGPTLAKVLADRPGPFSPAEAAEIIRLLALAVHAAHTKGVVHRDLKPGNVLLDAERGEFVVTDFGLARVAEPGDPRGSATGMVGTPAYMPPEQARGDSAAIGPASDVYALGVILFELLTGRLPFDGGSVADVVAKVLTIPPPVPSTLRPGVPPGLDALCQRALAKDPADRPASARELADDLLSFTVRDTVQEPRLAPIDAQPPILFESPTAEFALAPGGLVPSQKPRRPHFARWVAVGVVLVAGVAAAVYFTRPGDGGNTTPGRTPTDPGPKAAPGTPPKAGFDQVAERRAVEWVLRAGGAVEVTEPGGEAKRVPSAAALPTAFRVSRIELKKDKEAMDDTAAAILARLSGPVAIDIWGCQRLTNTGIAALARIPALEMLGLKHAPQVTDAGVSAFAGHPNLKRVYLTNTGITSVGVAALARIPNLEELGLHGHAITDSWLAAAAKAPNLQQLYVGYSRDFPGAGTTAAGFAHLAGLKHLYLLDLDEAAIEPGTVRRLPEMPSLDQLFLRRTSIMDADLAVLEKYPRLRTLGLHETAVTDAGMAAVARCPSLERLYLEGTEVGDTGLRALTGCPTLRGISLSGTKVTATGVREFQQVLPECRVTGGP